MKIFQKKGNTHTLKNIWLVRYKFLIQKMFPRNTTNSINECLCFCFFLFSTEKSRDYFSSLTLLFAKYSCQYKPKLKFGSREKTRIVNNLLKKKTKQNRSRNEKRTADLKKECQKLPTFRCKWPCEEKEENACIQNVISKRTTSHSKNSRPFDKFLSMTCKQTHSFA